MELEEKKLGKERTAIGEEIRPFLKKEDLEEYADRIIEQGYKKLSVLRGLDYEGFRQLVDTIGMKKSGHIETLRQALGIAKGKRKLLDAQTEANKRLFCNDLIIRGEGIQLTDPFITLREETCKNIFGALDKNHIMLIRAPPFSGKTALTTIFAQYLLDEDDGSVYVLSLLDMKGLEDFDAFWNRETEGLTYQDCFQATKRTTVLLDEVQKIYPLGQGHPFWQGIKRLLQKPNPHFHMLMLGAYGERAEEYNSSSGTIPGTPVVFGPELTMGLETMRFTEEEYNELMLNYHMKTRVGSLLPLSSEVQSVIFSSTKGHPGLISTCVESICSEFLSEARGGVKVDDSDLVAFLSSRRFFQDVERTRAVIKRPFTEEERQFIDAMLLLESRTIDVPSSPEELNLVASLTWSGIVGVVDKVVAFSAPLVESVCYQRLHTSRMKNLFHSTDFDLVVRECILRMDCRILQDSFSRSSKKDPLIERQWQMEFYRTATSLLPSDCSISPDVGSIFGSKGDLDFYVNGKLQWAIELLREGNDMKEHEDRFLKGGDYYLFRKKIKHYAILDFRKKAKKVRKMKDHFWYIMYSPDFGSVTIKRKGKSDDTIPLQSQTD